MRTRFLTGDLNWRIHGAKWVSPKLNNGDFDYWLVVDFINMDEACEEYDRDKYVAEIHAVSPQEVGEKNLEAALGCCGIDDDVEITDEIKVECLDTYGVFALCDSFSGKNARKVLRKAKGALDVIAGMLGFFMDGIKNGIGHTGWDCIKGDMTIATAEANRKRWKDSVPRNMHVL